MLEKLKIKAIYDDFLENVNLNETQIKILDMLLKKETIVKISLDLSMSERAVGYEIRRIKDLYNDYYNLQMLRAMLLLQ